MYYQTVDEALMFEDRAFLWWAASRGIEMCAMLDYCTDIMYDTIHEDDKLPRGTERKIKELRKHVMWLEENGAFDSELCLLWGGSWDMDDIPGFRD